jgi:hypothetical protein
MWDKLGCKKGAGGTGRGAPARCQLGEAHQMEIGLTTGSGTPSTVLAEQRAPTPQQAGPQYQREDYAVRHHWVDRIMKIFNLDKSRVRDAFATGQNRRFDKFWDVHQDALKQVWSPQEVYWCNPPWSLWPATVKKIEDAGCEVVAVVPAWDKPWVTKILGMAQRIMYMETGTRLFEVDKRVMPGIRWGIYVVWIPVFMSPLATDDRMMYAGWSSSARRRWRRRLLQQSVAPTGVPLASGVAST